jgi:hypothetical protein
MHLLVRECHVRPGFDPQVEVLEGDQAGGMDRAELDLSRG